MDLISSEHQRFKIQGVALDSKSAPPPAVTKAPTNAPRPTQKHRISARIPKKRYLAHLGAEEMAADSATAASSAVALRGPHLLLARVDAVAPALIVAKILVVLPGKSARCR